MGRHKKPPRKCASETCDRTITTRSLCARCQKRKQRARYSRNKQQSMAGIPMPGTPPSSLGMSSVGSNAVIAPAPPNLHHQRVMTVGNTGPYVIPMPANGMSNPPPLPSITHLDGTSVHLDHDPQAVRKCQVPSDFVKAEKQLECECCPTLQKAVINGHVHCVRSFISDENFDERALVLDMSKGETIFHLLGRCATVHDRDYETICTLLINSLGEGRVKVFMDERNEDGQTPLFCASRYHDCGSHEHNETDALKVCKIFLDSGADPDATDNYRRTPLHDTTWQITRLLLERGADVNKQDMNGDTPLHRAAMALHANVVHELVNQGHAQQEITNRHGQTPRDVVGNVLYDSFRAVGLSVRDFEREQSVTLQQFHSAPSMHMSMSPIQHRTQPHLLHPHQMAQVSVGSGLLPGLLSAPLNPYTQHLHHAAHHVDLHHQGDSHHHPHLHPHLVQYPHANPMGE